MAYSRTKSKQDWSVGSTVKVGWQTLRVTGGSTACWTLESLNGRRQYEFEPYRGLFRVN